jgi:acetoin utilization protein AcuB
MTRYHQPIDTFMSATVHTIDLETSLPDARRRMTELGVRHLPVLDGRNIVGLLSDRDLARLEGFPMVDFNLVSVPDAMSDDPYVVGPKTPVIDVVRTMREHRYGSAIVADHGRVVGIFTTTDVLGLTLAMLEPEVA